MERELAYYKARLEDPTLLDRAVVVDGLLAVPVGGRRRGGYVNVDGADIGRRVIAALVARPDFPNPRYEPGDDEVADLVRWGDAEPPTPRADASDAAWLADDIASGRFYGYSDRAIQSFIRRQRT